MRVDYKGKQYTVAELARKLNLKYYTLHSRVRMGNKLDSPVRKWR